jgi:hypothetical protein
MSDLNVYEPEDEPASVQWRFTFQRPVEGAPQRPPPLSALPLALQTKRGCVNPQPSALVIPNPFGARLSGLVMARVWQNGESSLIKSKIAAFGIDPITKVSPSPRKCFLQRKALSLNKP